MDPLTEPRKDCPLCGSRELRPAHSVYYWKENLLRYSDCLGCGATFANPMPGDEVIAAGNGALVRLYQQGRTPEHEFRDARQAYLRGKMLAKKLRRWKPRGRLLELGCYQGFFALGVRDNCAWEVHGLEISSELCEFVRASLGIPCHEGTLEAARLPNDEYDFIVCHDLIEHINQPRKFLAELHRILKPGGRIQIITPNNAQDIAYTRRAFAAGISLTMLLNHIIYFRPRTLRYALQSANLRPLRLYCYDVKHALKDFGWFGMGKPVKGIETPSIVETMKLPAQDNLKFWTPEKLAELRSHPKTTWRYGFLKETLPKFFSVKVPFDIEIGHEIYALAEKRE